MVACSPVGPYPSSCMRHPVAHCPAPTPRLTPGVLVPPGGAGAVAAGQGPVGHVIALRHHQARQGRGAHAGEVAPLSDARPCDCTPM
jgi:hypothetical protein